jgi:hypothetical protein
MESNLVRRALDWKSLALAAGFAATTLFATDLKADDGRHGGEFFQGPFESDTVPPPTCTSPVGLCTHGTLSGSFPADYDFTFATLQSAGDPTDPTEFVYTGHSTVTTPAGVMHTNDSGMIHIPATGLAPFVTTANIAVGTGVYVGATGAFVATGNLDFSTGHAVGSFFARIVTSR